MRAVLGCSCRTARRSSQKRECLGFRRTRGTRRYGVPWASPEPSGPPWTGGSRPLLARLRTSPAFPLWSAPAWAKKVLERLVSPVVGGVHSADPALLDVDMVAPPGLRAGIRAQGSLAAAVAAQRKAAKGSGGASGPAKAGSAVAGLRGGMNTLVDALVADLRERGVELLTGQHADDVVKAPEAGGSPPGMPRTTPAAWWSRLTARPLSGCWRSPCLSCPASARLPVRW